MGPRIILAVLLLVQAAFAETVRPVRLRWDDLPGMITAKRVAVNLTDGSVRRGTVRRLTPGAIELDRTPPVDRAAIAEIRLTAYSGNARHAGKLIGGTAGLVAGLVGAAAIGLREGSGSRTGDKAAAAVLGVGGLPLGMLAGWLIGRQADREVTVIRIIP